MLNVGREVMTGKVPWKGLMPAQIICGVAFNDLRLDIPADVHPELQRLMEDCWKKDPEERPDEPKLSPRSKILRGKMGYCSEDEQPTPRKRRDPGAEKTPSGFDRVLRRITPQTAIVSSLFFAFFALSSIAPL